VVWVTLNMIVVQLKWLKVIKNVSAAWIIYIVLFYDKLLHIDIIGMKLYASYHVYILMNLLTEIL